MFQLPQNCAGVIWVRVHFYLFPLQYTHSTYTLTTFLSIRWFIHFAYPCDDSTFWLCELMIHTLPQKQRRLPADVLVVVVVVVYFCWFFKMRILQEDESNEQPKSNGWVRFGFVSIDYLFESLLHTLELHLAHSHTYLFPLLILYLSICLPFSFCERGFSVVNVCTTNEFIIEIQ